jgi:hypothetical protein
LKLELERLKLFLLNDDEKRLLKYINVEEFFKMKFIEKD